MDITPRRLGTMGIPSAAYRLQLNGEFPWALAKRIVPYLADLGVGAAYVSPIVMARPGSRHGYDVVDLGKLNPELGSDHEMSDFSRDLREHGLGLIVDVVPNHLSIWGSANRSWNDVLENGPSSPFARWFDIDRTPPKPDLEAKILLPVPGDQFGRVLEAGDIKVAYQDGAFVAHYHDLSFPVAPKCWPQILNPALTRRPGRSKSPCDSVCSWRRPALCGRDPWSFLRRPHRRRRPAHWRRLGRHPRVASTLFPAGRPPPSLRDALSGQILRPEILGGQLVLPLSKAFARLPVALLEAMA